MSRLNWFLAILALVAIPALGCEDIETDLRSTDGPAAVPPAVGHAPDGGAAAPAPEVEVKTQALWVNPPSAPCTGEGSNVVRLYRWNDSATPCLQFPANMEIAYLGWYLWPDGASLNDNVRAVVGDVHLNPGKTQRVTVWSEWMFGGSVASHQVTYTGQPGQGWNVWLYNPWQFSFGASSLRYETW